MKSQRWSTTYHIRLSGSRLAALLILTVIGVGALNADSHQARSQNTFLMVSDIHFDPMGDPSLVSKLAASDPAQWETILGQSKRTSFSQYGEDTNWWLLQSSLNAMKDRIPHPAFIMTNGDMLAHRFPSTFKEITHDEDQENYRKFVRKTIDFLVLQFRKRYPGTPIFVTPGNNDDECGNYSIYAGGEFLHDTAEVARELAHGDNDLKSSWEALGSYDIANPAIRGVRIISLNTVFLSEMYRAANFKEGCAAETSSAANALLSWLESRLSRAQQAHEKVWLMFHIPPGIDSFTTMEKYQALLRGKPDQGGKICDSAVVPMWVPKWTADFDALLKKYQDTIIASFAGHTHSDDFRIVNPSGKNPEFILITASVSPIYNQNPSFRLVKFAADGSLLDSSVYYLSNLMMASSTSAGVWRREYTFSKQWKLQRIDAASLGVLYGRIKSPGQDRDDWLKFYNVSSSVAHLPANAMTGFYCAIEGLAPGDYAGCYCGSPASGASGSIQP